MAWCMSTIVAFYVVGWKLRSLDEFLSDNRFMSVTFAVRSKSMTNDQSEISGYWVVLSDGR
jgi:hypothetical protein